MKVIMIDPVDELEIHGLTVYSAESAQRIDDEWRYQESVRHHEIERILIRNGFCEIMKRTDKTPSNKEASMLRKIAAGDGIPGETPP